MRGPTDRAQYHVSEDGPGWCTAFQLKAEEAASSTAATHNTLEDH